MRPVLRYLTVGMTATSLLLAGAPAVTAAPATSVNAEEPIVAPIRSHIEAGIITVSTPTWALGDRSDGEIYGGDTISVIPEIPEGSTATYEWFTRADGHWVSTGVKTQTHTLPLLSNDILVQVLSTAADGTITEQRGERWVNRAHVSTGTYVFENKPVPGERLYWKVAPIPGIPAWAEPTLYRADLLVGGSPFYGQVRNEGNGRFSSLVGLDLGGKEVTAYVHGIDDYKNKLFMYGAPATGSGLVVPHVKPRHGQSNLPVTIRVGDRFTASTGTGWPPIFADGQIALTLDGQRYQQDSIEWEYDAKYLGKTVIYEVLQRNVLSHEWVPMLKKSYKVGLGTVPAQTLKIGSEGKTDTRTAKVGSRLHANKHGGVGLPKEKVAYQWLRNGKTITGATKSTYVLAAADYEKIVSFTATTSAPGYITKTLTLKTGTKVTVGTSKSGKVSIAGTRRPGKTVKASVSSWAPGSKLSYQWLRNGKSIKGATKSSYKLTKADASKSMSVKVTAKRHAYATVSKTSRTEQVARK